MANIYVRSGASGAANGTSWADAYTTLAAAAAASAAGDDIWVALDHAETQASAMTITLPGTAASPNRIFCVNHAGSVPPVAADIQTSPSGSITTTGNNAITMTGWCHVEGLIFSSGSGAASVAMSLANTAPNVMTAKNCSFRLGGTTGGSISPHSSSSGKAVWENCSVQFASANSSVIARLGFNWINTPNPLPAGTMPSTLFSAGACNIQVRNVDLSALSGKTAIANMTSATTNVTFSRCKLPSSFTKFTTMTGGLGTSDFRYIQCANSGGALVHEKYDYAGQQVLETTIYRTGGAGDGTTAFAWKIDTTANAKPHAPYESLPIEMFNETVGSFITVTLQGIWGGGAVPTNADIWMRVEYLSASGDPLGASATNARATLLTTPANLSAGSGTWGGSTTKFELSATFMPQQKGFLRITVFCGAASSTFYIDPLPVVSGVTFGKSYPGPNGVLINELGSGGGPPPAPAGSIMIG